MKKFLKSISDFRGAILVLLIALLWNEVIYLVPRAVAQSWYHYDMTTAIDNLVPFLPWTVSIYFGCFAVWCVNFCLCAVQEAPERDRFFCADLLAKAVCFLVFLVIPTTNIRPEVTGETFWDMLMRMLYSIDSADNLFPSVHCLVSWLCWVGIRKRKDIPALYRHFSLVAAVAVCIATLTTRQHVIADVIGGILLAEGSYLITGIEKVRKCYSAVITFLKNKLFPKRAASS